MAYILSLEYLAWALRERALKFSKVPKELGNHCDDLAETWHIDDIYEQLAICRVKGNFDLLSTQ